MRIGQDFEKNTLRSCGHIDSVRYRYTNLKQRTEQELRASRTICSCCRATVQAWSDQLCGAPAAQAARWNSRLPQLEGTAGQLSWAASNRRLAGEHFYALLEHVSMDMQQPAAAARTVLRLLFSIPACRFWIDAKPELLSPSWLAKEVELLMRASDTLCPPMPSTSVVGYWKARRPELIETTRRNLRCPQESAA